MVSNQNWCENLARVEIIIIIIIIIINHRVKLKESEKKDKYLDLARKLKKTVEHESDVYTNCNLCSWYSHGRIIKGTGGIGNKRTRRDSSNYNIVEIGQDTKSLQEVSSCPGDLGRLAVTQTSENDHQLTLM